MTLHDDRTFVRHFSWVIIFLAAMLIIFIILSFAIVGVSGVESHSGYSYVQYMHNHPGAAAPGSASGQAQSVTAEGQASGQKVAANNSQSGAGASGAQAGGASANGKSVWTAHCATCHKSGVAGAPKIGDNAAWSKLAKEAGSVATLHHRAINGYSGSLGFMPPKGGASGLSDGQVKAAANYMLEQSGVSVPQSGGAQTSGAKSSETHSGGAKAAGSAGSGNKTTANGKTSANGKSVWTAHCAACHKTGVAGAPKIGDKNAWAGIFKKTDHATLYKHAIEGFQGDRGFMPPKGGASDLSDSQVKAAVDYMIDQSGFQSH
jgi:cytochrome c5